MINDEIMEDIHKDPPKKSLRDKLLYYYIYSCETVLYWIGKLLGGKL